MSKRVILKFEHPLATHGSSTISKGLIASSHLCLGIHALTLFTQGLNFFILLALMLLAGETLRKNPEAKPYLKELTIRAGLQILVLSAFMAGVLINHDVWHISIGKSFKMLMFTFIFLNFYEAVEAFRGRLPIRVFKNNK